MGLQHRIRPVAPAPAKEPKPAAAKPAGKKRGPKPSGSAKVLLTLRLDPDVVARFKATGKGWQARMNDALARAVIPD